MKLACSLLVFSFFTLAFPPAFSQKKFSMSVSAGPTINNVYGAMVRRNDDYGGNYKKRDKVGYAINVGIERKLSQEAFLYSGLGITRKQINPMEESIFIYEDKLKTTYLSIPLGVGLELGATKSFHFILTIGSVTHFCLADKSIIGPDRVAFRASTISESIGGGLKINIDTGPGKFVFFQYSYMHDITNTYIETLYWSNAEPRKKFDYRYKTQTIVFGFSWALKAS